MRGRWIAMAVVLALVTNGTATARSVVVLDRPVPGAVLAGFDAPTRYGPGHRGVDLAAAPGSPVRAAAAGRVTFAGRVVGSTWVTVDHGDVRTTVGPLGSMAVQRGAWVGRGAVLGTSGHAHGRAALHWSARTGDTYVDPLTVGRVVASLVPDRLVPRGVWLRAPSSGPVRSAHPRFTP